MLIKEPWTRQPYRWNKFYWIGQGSAYNILITNLSLYVSKHPKMINDKTSFLHCYHYHTDCCNISFTIKPNFFFFSCWITIARAIIVSIDTAVPQTYGNRFLTVPLLVNRDQMNSREYTDSVDNWLEVHPIVAANFLREIVYIYT